MTLHLTPLAARIAMTGAIIVALLTAAPAPLEAQVRPVRMLSLEGAQKALVAATAEARKQNWAVSIAVVDAFGELVAFARLDGASLGSVDVSRAKARTAARFRRPTKSFDSTLTAGRLAILGIDGVTPVEGGVPIIVNGEIVGAVGVSGVTSAQDAQVATAGAGVITP